MKISPANSSYARFWPWLGLLLVLLIVGFIRIRLLETPLERDEGEYAYAGQLILQGIPPYEQAYNMKLPGTYYAYAAGMAVFGQTATGVHLTLLVVNGLTAVFVLLLGRKLFGTMAGLLSCASYALMSASPAVLGLAAHATQFVMLFAVPGTLLLYLGCEANDRRLLSGAGLLFGLSLLMKQPAICFGLFGFLVLLAQGIRKRQIASRRFWGTIGLYSLAGLLPFLFFCLATKLAGDFGRFWFWTFDYAKIYAVGCDLSLGMKNLIEATGKLLPAFFEFMLLALAGAIMAWNSSQHRTKLVFVAAWLACSFVGVLPGLYFRGHYFVLLLPAVSVLAGAVAGTATAGCDSKTFRHKQTILVAVFAAIIGFDLWWQRAVFFVDSPREVCQQTYPQNPFIESVSAAEYLREHSRPEDQVAVIGSEPEIYFYAHRHSATGYIYLYPLMEAQPFAARMQQEMISEIEKARPKFLVLVMYRYSWLMKKASSTAVLDWSAKYARKYYEPEALAGLRPDGEIVWLQGDEATGFHDKLDGYLTVYRRKADKDITD